MENPEQKENNTSELLQLIVVKNHNELISVGEIKNSLHERGFGVLLAIAALPLCLPIPVPPGYSTFFSIPLFIFSVQMMWGMSSPWIPQWLAVKQIKKVNLDRMVQKATPWLRKIESYLHPRLTYISTRAWERIIGIFAFIFSLSIALPIPLTNFPPGWGILIMSLGLLSKDGLTIIAGMIVGTVGVGITLVVLALLWMGVSMPDFYG
ncbi:MAG TPA: exopolysaccharide biosynthesis protein [Nitrosomonas mobilis]|uniref:Exopolysaccharide synthesis, ExoD n=1 Tax=Nitrosomonas mobilis TaxID=51642 RepID=A0A1G5SAQ3_9PROT|nr:Exopolysaccharide synthesis, ExoD [Nitrosomonas mobilis]HNO74427.1 exopolysaccharide biosynthesis protein [Nitrosomonas mobilis]